MAFTFPTYTAGVTTVVTWVNQLVTKLAAYLNAIPGSALSAGTVAPAALQKPRAQQAWSFLEGQGPGGLVAANLANADAQTILNIDGASATYEITGWSFHTGNNATALAARAGAQLLVKVAGVTQITIDISNTSGLAVGTPVSAVLGTAIAVTSGQKVTIDYVFGAAGAAYPCPKLVLYVSAPHVST